MEDVPHFMYPPYPSEVRAALKTCLYPSVYGAEFYPQLWVSFPAIVGEPEYIIQTYAIDQSKRIFAEF
jgi:hypothetical protein